MTRRSIGVGLLGVGWMGQLHTRSYRRLAEHFPELEVDIRLVAAADPRPARRALATELGYASATEDWREVVADPEVDVISVAAPNYLHRDMGVAAARSGKPFWGEKPLGRDAAETEEIARAVAEAGVVTTVGFNYRYVPLVEHVRALVASGALGVPTGYRGWFLNDYASRPDGVLSWRFRRALGGSGALGDLMSHVADLAQFLLGPVAEVVATTDLLIPERPLPTSEDAGHFTVGGGPSAPVENEDAARALVRFASGLGGYLEVGRAVVGPHCSLGFELYGTEGSVRWDFERMNELDRYVAGGAGGDVGFQRVLARPGHGEYHRFQPGPAISMSYDDLKVVEASRFVASVLGGEPAPGGVPDALAAARVIAAIETSASSRAWVSVGDRSAP